MRRKKTLAIMLGLSVISLLIVRDIYSLWAHSEGNTVLEERQYSRESSAFRTFFSKLPNSKEENILHAVGSSLDDVASNRDAINIDGDTGDDGGIVTATENDSEAVDKTTEMVDESVRFRPLTRASPEDGEDAEEKNEEQKLHTEISQSTFKQNSISSALAIPKHNYMYLNRSSNNFMSNTQQKTAIDAIKKLLLYNETESAEALWKMAQNQHSMNKKSSQSSYAPSPTTTAYKTSNQFHVKSSMSWPLPQFTKTDILQAQWVDDLKQYLQWVLVGRQISVVTANLEHQEVVLNWLISAVTVAKLSPRTVLVLSLSAQLHDFLISKKMNSILVHPTSVMNKAGLKRITSAFNQIHIIRLTFFRLLNHWGYDVVMYDSDAVVLKNPQPLFDANQGVELVGSAGKGPENIGHIWGRTICTGVLLLRTSPGLEIWWEKMSKVARVPFTDQGLVNIALKSLHVQWDQFSPLNVNRDMHGSCKNTQLEAVILSEEKICRYHCDTKRRTQYYVWHKPAIKRNRTVENKKRRARDGGAWLLRDDWTQRSKMTTLTGVTWLLSIAENV